MVLRNCPFAHEGAKNAAYQHDGRLDIIYSNTAASIDGTASEISEADWDWTIAVCLKATWMLAHCAVPRMLADGGGVMIITGAVHSIRGYANASAYQAAKGGVLALTRSLAIDHAPTIQVNAILPGAIETGLWKDVMPEHCQKIAQHCILRRNNQLEDIRLYPKSATAGAALVGSHRGRGRLSTR